MALGIALLLGLIQGLTEFLPISSSGHLRLFGAALGIENPDTLFDVAVHAGTLGAVLAVFRGDIKRMAVGLTQPKWSNSGFRLVGLVAIGTVPAAVLGLLWGHWLESHMSAIPIVGLLLIFNGTILMATRSFAAKGRTLDQLTIKDALIIGCAQSVALLRGISRSGITISTALMTGVSRDAAVTFSFLLAIPVIGGAVLLKLAEALAAGAGSWAVLTVGTVTAAASGYWALTVLLKVVRSGRFHHFAWYCWAAGLTAIVVWAIP
jgi:undecaprenyl-diphosphatase